MKISRLHLRIWQPLLTNYSAWQVCGTDNYVFGELVFSFLSTFIWAGFIKLTANCARNSRFEQSWERKSDLKGSLNRTSAFIPFKFPERLNQFEKFDGSFYPPDHSDVFNVTITLSKNIFTQCSTFCRLIGLGRIFASVSRAFFTSLFSSL